MNMWGKIRATGYVTAAVTGGAWLLHASGLAVYDPTTGMIDPEPFNVNWVIGIVAPVAASVVAPVALFLGWGKKP